MGAAICQNISFKSQTKSEAGKIQRDPTVREQNIYISFMVAQTYYIIIMLYYTVGYFPL